MKWLLLGTFTCLSSCSDRFSETDLVGGYQAYYRGESATLTLNKDHTYTQSIRLRDGQAVDGSGAWNVVQVSSATIVEFSDFGFCR
jgi:hypothetical protein